MSAYPYHKETETQVGLGHSPALPHQSAGTLAGVLQAGEVGESRALRSSCLTPTSLLPAANAGAEAASLVIHSSLQHIPCHPIMGQKQQQGRNVKPEGGGEDTKIMGAFHR